MIVTRERAAELVKHYHWSLVETFRKGYWFYGKIMDDAGHYKLYKIERAY